MSEPRIWNIQIDHTGEQRSLDPLAARSVVTHFNSLRLAEVIASLGSNPDPEKRAYWQGYVKALSDLEELFGLMVNGDDEEDTA